MQRAAFRQSSRQRQAEAAGREWHSIGFLGTQVVPFFPFYVRVSLLKLNVRKNGTLIIQGLLGNLGLRLRVEDFVVEVLAHGGLEKGS